MFELLITIGICGIFGLFMYATEDCEWVQEFGKYLGIKDWEE